MLVKYSIDVVLNFALSFKQLIGKRNYHLIGLQITQEVVQRMRKDLSVFKFCEEIPKFFYKKVILSFDTSGESEAKQHVAKFKDFDLAA